MTVRPFLVAALALTQVAWTQYFTSTGAPVRWNRAEVVVLTDSAGTADVPGDLEFGAVSRSMDTWNAVACPHPLLVDGGRVTGVKPGSGTGKNLLIWVTDRSDWSSPGLDHVIALTTLYYDDRSGVAAKFDMEFADFDYEFTVTDVPALVRTDLQNTVTHEMGHVLGLDHSRDPDATMYYSASPGDTTKRTLAQDDITGLCAVYFAWTHPDPDSPSAVEGGLVVEETGVPSANGGCRAGARSGSDRALLGAFLILLGLGSFRLLRTPRARVALLALIGPGWTHLTTEEGKPLRWKVDRVAFFFDSSSGTPDISDDIEWDVIGVAMTVWNEVPCGQPPIEGIHVSSPPPAASESSNGIAFRDDEITTAGTIAYTLNAYVTTTGEITSSSIVFNDRVRFTVLSSDVNVDLGSIAVHELGHALGLGHSGRFRATMYPYYFRGTTFSRDPSHDDASGLCALYGGSLPEDWTSSWPWEDPPCPLQCEDGCEALPTGLPALQATYPAYDISRRRGCAAGSGTADQAGLAGLGGVLLLLWLWGRSVAS